MLTSHPGSLPSYRGEPFSGNPTAIFPASPSLSCPHLSSKVSQHKGPGGCAEMAWGSGRGGCGCGVPPSPRLRAGGTEAVVLHFLSVCVRGTPPLNLHLGKRDLHSTSRASGQRAPVPSWEKGNVSRREKWFVPNWGRVRGKRTQGTEVAEMSPGCCCKASEAPGPPLNRTCLGSGEHVLATHRQRLCLPFLCCPSQPLRLS